MAVVGDAALLAFVNKDGDQEAFPGPQVPYSAGLRDIEMAELMTYEVRAECAVVKGIAAKLRIV